MRDGRRQIPQRQRLQILLELAELRTGNRIRKNRDEDPRTGLQQACHIPGQGTYVNDDRPIAARCCRVPEKMSPLRTGYLPDIIREKCRRDDVQVPEMLRRAFQQRRKVVRLLLRFVEQVRHIRPVCRPEECFEPAVILQVQVQCPACLRTDLGKRQ